MGRQVIKQPDGLYAIWSSVTDSIEVWDATREEIIEEYIDAASAEARRWATMALGVADGLQTVMFEYNDGMPPVEVPVRRTQFTKTWKQALRDHTRRHGPLKEDA